MSKYYPEFLIDVIKLEFGLEFGSWCSNMPLQEYNFMINFPAALALFVTSSGVLISSTYDLTVSVTMIMNI